MSLERSLNKHFVIFAYVACYARVLCKSSVSGTHKIALVASASSALAASELGPGGGVGGPGSPNGDASSPGEGACPWCMRVLKKGAKRMTCGLHLKHMSKGRKDISCAMMAEFQCDTRMWQPRIISQRGKKICSNFFQ